MSIVVTCVGFGITLSQQYPHDPLIPIPRGPGECCYHSDPPSARPIYSPPMKRLLSQHIRSMPHRKSRKPSRAVCTIKRPMLEFVSYCTARSAPCACSLSLQCSDKEVRTCALDQHLRREESGSLPCCSACSEYV